MNNHLTKYISAVFAAVWIFLILFPSGIQPKTSLTLLEVRLREDIADSHLDRFTKVEAAFILSGVRRPDSLEFYTSWYDDLTEKIRNYPFDRFDHMKAAGQVFNYLHSTWLKTYQRESTDLLSIVHHREYNCVAATLLYNFVCEDLGWETEAFETPTHVYTLFGNLTERIAVENTSPMGFDIMRNLRAYSHHLAQYYPEKEVYRIGLDRLYAYENSNGRVINNTELIGLLAYNRAYFSRKKGDFARAYDLVLLAQDFNIDSRSNVNFEKNLYYIWGKTLFDQKRNAEAFSVFADAVYRYPDVPDFHQNTRAAFFRSLDQYWTDKNWADTRRLVDEILVLDVLTEDDEKPLAAVLTRWRDYFERAGDAVRRDAAETALSRIMSVN
ncbi:hypothetical protein JW948_00990 [bacterium]|nr:hypothetical protein [bacterium]